LKNVESIEVVEILDDEIKEVLNGILKNLESDGCPTLSISQ
jgi:hypothetical protein